MLVVVQEAPAIVMPHALAVVTTTMIEELHQARVLPMKVEEDQLTTTMEVEISEHRDLKVSTDRLLETGKWTAKKKKVVPPIQQRKAIRRKDNTMLRTSLRATTSIQLLQVTEEDWATEKVVVTTVILITSMTQLIKTCR